MADFQPVSEAELEGSPPPPTAQAPATPPSEPTQGYEPVNDNDLAPAAPMFQPGFRGPRGGIPNIPAAAAQRFKDSDAFNNILQTAATRFANGFVNTFSALTIKDQQAMRDAGYGPGDFNSAGGALRWGAHVFGSTFNVLQDGFLALGPGIIEGVGGAAEQASRETGIGDPEMVGHEASGMAEAAMADVGDMHAMSMVDAAKAQAKAPGVYSQAFRVDQTPGGGLVHTPLGRLPPVGPESIAQAQVAADALHLPPETADLIHQIYTETGRPPAEVLMDAKANNGGVLSDLVAGKVPTVYHGSPNAALETISANPPVRQFDNATSQFGAFFSPSADEAARYAGKEGKIYSAGVQLDKPYEMSMGEFLRFQAPERKNGVLLPPEQWGAHAEELKTEATSLRSELQTQGYDGIIVKRRNGEVSEMASFKDVPITPPEAPTAPPSGPIPYTPGVAKVGLSIERKAIEQGLTKAFPDTARYGVKDVKGQRAMVSQFIADNAEDARAVVRGEKPVPEGMSPTMFIDGMEMVQKLTKDADLAHELSNSPLTSGTSYAAQEMRMMQERTPDSATAASQQIKDAMVKQAGGPEVVATRTAAVKQARPEANGVFLPKEQLSIDRFLNEIKC